jgi:hypothetical protein
MEERDQTQVPNAEISEARGRNPLTHHPYPHSNPNPTSSIDLNPKSNSNANPDTKVIGVPFLGRLCSSQKMVFCLWFHLA